MRLFFILLFSSLFFNFTLQAQPWGKDAELVSACPRVQKEEKIKTPLLGEFGEVMIGFHQNVVSEADGPRSHYFPSSSQYTLEAMRKYGFGWGFIKGCDRLMRENDDLWVYELVTKGNTTLKWNPP